MTLGGEIWASVLDTSLRYRLGNHVERANCSSMWTGSQGARKRNLAFCLEENRNPNFQRSQKSAPEFKA